MSAVDTIFGISGVTRSKGSDRWQELAATQPVGGKSDNTTVNTSTTSLDVSTLGPLAKRHALAQQEAASAAASSKNAGDTTETSTAAATTASASDTSAATSAQTLSASQQAEIARLEQRDREVRAHEAAHLTAAGSLASGVQYTYTLGPDGKLYAVEGKVNIAVTSSTDPEEALSQARQLLAAASAPGDPSNQDLTVAVRARQMESEAQAQLAELKAKAQADTVPAASSASAQHLNRTA
jgi:hypothetical protein